MNRNWTRIALPVLLLAGLVAGTAHAASSKNAPSPSKGRNAMHQFTGVVTALDKQSLTVEKSGKQPMTRTFVRHDDMTTQGELAKDARVTVYYRDEGGKSVAHRVVVKAAAETASSS
ncbi:MAG TPA: hypothetical protein VMJ70_11840 [Candidatus Sulfotelmatobacter sp.]|nr:hypothetical protein [Candidatus Sulfotelmatobacter sp.]